MFSRWIGIIRLLRLGYNFFIERTIKSCYNFHGVFMGIFVRAARALYR